MPVLPAIAVRTADLADLRERRRIDDFVRAQDQATPFHLTGWSSAVAQGCGQRAHLLVAERDGGALVGILPLSDVRSAVFGRALVSTGFGVGGGILTESAAAVTALGEAAWALAQRLGCPTLELRGGPVAGPGWRIDDHSYLGFARALAASDDAELAAIPRKQRAELRKALALDLEIATGRDAGAAREHYRVYSESVRNLGTPVFPAKLFRAVLDQFGDAADVLTVRAAGAPVASVLSLYLNGTVYPYWGGGTAAARALRANDRLYFALMAHARARGCTRFDFGRSKVGTGAAAFKKNWGFEGVPLVYAKRVADGAAARAINPLNPKYRMQVAAWKRLPLWAANAIGPLVSRGLG